MHVLGTRNAAIWGLTGGALSLLLVFTLAWIFERLTGSMQQGPAYFLSSFVLTGPATIWNSGWWQAPIDGAGIAAVLSLVDRAFNRVDTAETGASGGERRSSATRGNLRPEPVYVRQRNVTGPCNGWTMGWFVRRERASSSFNSKYQRACRSASPTRIMGAPRGPSRRSPTACRSALS